MKARVVKLNINLPTAEARAENDILIAFRPPVDGSISLAHELEIDLVQVDGEQDVLNSTTGKTLRLSIEAQNVHDLRLPGGHGKLRFPSLDRRTGG